VGKAIAARKMERNAAASLMFVYFYNLGIELLWLIRYMYASLAVFYEELIRPQESAAS
jgi:hypothetical protein